MSTSKSLPCVRRSERIKKKPERLGFEVNGETCNVKGGASKNQTNQTDMAADKPLQNITASSRTNVAASKISKKNNSAQKSKVTSTKSRNSKIMQAELALEKEKRLIEIERRASKLEHEKRLLEKEIQLKQIELEESVRSHKSLVSTEEEDNKTVTSKSSFVNDWIESLPLPERNEKTLDNDHKIRQLMTRQCINKDLPDFFGQPWDWINFITQFKETTEICGFTNSENMSRLRKCLKGKARDCVNALLSFTQDVDKIIKTLEKNFGRPEVIIQYLIETVTKIPNIRDDRIETIVDFSNKVQNLSVTITSLKRYEYLSNPQLITDLTKKLNPTLKMEWGRKIVQFKRQEKSITVNEFAMWLEEYSEAAMYVSQCDPDHHQKKKYVYTASTSNENQIDNKITYMCKFCKQEGHKVEKCGEFKKIDVDKRWEWVRAKKVCFSCLTSSHQTRQCRNKKSCPVEGCTFRHHQILHKYISRENAPNQEVNCHIATEEETNLCVNYKRHDILLRIVPVELRGPNGKINTYALLDEGSTITMIDSSIADSIGALGPQDPLTVRWTNSIINEERESQRISLCIRGQSENTSYRLQNVRTIRNLSLPVQSVNIRHLCQKWGYLQKIQLPNLKEVQPKILIGHDNIDLIIPREIFEGGKNSPMLTKSKLGWVVHGNICNGHFLREKDEFSFFVTQEPDSMDELVRNSFKIDCLGIKKIENLYTPEEQRALDILQETTKRVSPSKWESGLLWRNDDKNIPKSKYTAIARLKYIEKKMAKDNQFCTDYSKKISEYVTKNYAKKLTKEEIPVQNLRVWYLPHFVVTRADKPGHRLVFDAAAKTEGISLNDLLLKGPDLLNSLLGIVFRFRQRNIAFTADIKEMFHQVNIRPEDRHAQRFLWRNGEGSRDPDEYEMIAMTFGATSSPVTAQFVMRKNAEDFKDIFPNAEKAIRENHYVDDYLDSMDTINDAVKQISSVIEVHQRGGFVIRNWASNCKEILKNIPDTHRNDNIKNLNFDKGITLPTERVLGLSWNPNDDKFSLPFKWTDEDIKDLIEQTHVTKRQVLKTVMTIFDPLGFLCNFTIKGRILIQHIWKSKIGWDDEIDKKSTDKWKRWMIELQKIKNIQINRCYVTDIYKAQQIQLHVFCDASAQAYAAVAYFRIKFPTHISTSFVIAKSRVAPLKPMSIPRLELQAAVLGNRLVSTILENHDIPITCVYLWSDSQTVISWIKSNPALYKPFVAHRLAEIQENTDAKHWNWIPTNENVSDEATREDYSRDWALSTRWRDGPEFLKYEKSDWPIKDNLMTDTTEMKKTFIGVTVETTQLKSSLPDVTRFSSWLKLIRTTAWIIRIIETLMKKLNKRGELTCSELDNAEKLWIKSVQKDSFADEIKDLQIKKTISSSSRILKLSPFLDKDNILRLKSRILNADFLDDDTKFPVILDPKHIYTKLLITHYHKKARHHGQEMVLNELRQRYWILNARQAVRSCWNDCQWCKNRRSKETLPEMAPLPRCRLTPFVRPFTITGMDYFGPMEVSIGRRKEKRYGVLFTCMSTRAVHLEIAHSLTTDSAIMAIRRLAGRRGNPKKLFSDNGTNLRGAEKELRNALNDFDQYKIISTLSAAQIEWFFLPPLASHMAGSWERLIRSVKTSIKAILKEKSPREEVLQTIFVEAEYTVNCRPLTHVSLDYADQEALTPNHFLLGSPNGAQIPGIFDQNDLLSRKHWRQSQVLADHFWKRWIKEYLPVLTKRTKWFVSHPRKIKVGDIVVIVDQNFGRNIWPKGMVVKLYPGTDGETRVVDVKTPIGTYRRPLTKLQILDVSAGT